MASKLPEKVKDVDKNTPDVLAYRMTQVENAHDAQVKVTQDGFDKLEKKLDAYLSTFVRQQIFDAALERSKEIHKEMRADCEGEQKRTNQRIDVLESWNTWIVRIFLTLVITAVIGSVIVTKG